MSNLLDSNTPPNKTPNMRPTSTQLLNRTFPPDTLYMPMHHRWNNTPWRNWPDTHWMHWYHSNLH